MDFESKYKSLISNILQTTPDNIFLYWKGRVALYAILKAMRISEGDEVILPAFTCVVVPNAIKYLGAKPVYVDIHPDTYNVDVESVAQKITDKTKVIICQNTFGLSSHVEALQQLAQQHGIYTVEDCAHGFGGTYHQHPNGSYCDAAFYSTQWNKPFSTGVGGIAYVRNDEVKAQLLLLNQSLSPTSLKDALSLSILYFVRDKILNNFIYWKMIKLYRFLSNHNLVQGSSSGEELNSIVIPANYFKAISETQIKKGIENIKKLSDNLCLRKKNAQIYSDFLAKMGKNFVKPELFENHSFLKYPLLVKERSEVFHLAEKAHIPLGEWFCSPLHPIEGDLTMWDFDRKKFPVAGKKASQMVNLPTDVKDPTAVLAFLEQHKTYILT